jgi:hypothetical protein
MGHRQCWETSICTGEWPVAWETPAEGQRNEQKIRGLGRFCNTPVQLLQYTDRPLSKP